MYEYIKGTAEDIGTDYIVLEAGGLGYFITATGEAINMCRLGEPAKTAVQMLTTVSVQELAIALVTGDTAALTRVPGIGKKTAQRLILELRERVDNDELPSGGFQAAAAADEQCVNEAVGALVALGLPQAEAVRAVREAAQKADTAEEIIRIVLKGLDKM